MGCSHYDFPMTVFLSDLELGRASRMLLVWEVRWKGAFWKVSEKTSRAQSIGGSLEGLYEA